MYFIRQVPLTTSLSTDNKSADSILLTEAHCPNVCQSSHRYFLSCTDQLTPICGMGRGGRGAFSKEFENIPSVKVKLPLSTP